MTVAAHLNATARSNAISGRQPVTTAAGTIMMPMRSARHLSGSGEHGMGAHREGGRWCMCGRGHCVLRRGGIPGGIASEAYTGWEMREGMCGQRVPRMAMGWRGMVYMVCTHDALGMWLHLCCGTRSGWAARGGRPLDLSCRWPLRWSLERMSRARCRLCNMRTCKLSKNVCVISLRLSLVRRWRPESTRRICTAWGWVRGARG